MCELKNTVRFTFGNGADKPSLGEVANLVKCLDAELDEVEAAYRIGEEKSSFVKFKSERSMLHALTANTDKLIFHYGNGKEVKVHMSHAQDHICYVRIYDLPPEVSDQETVTVLSKYGRVKHVLREKFPTELGIPAYTGVRGAYIDVKQKIPSSLHFASWKGSIYYQGNKDKCFICKEPVGFLPQAEGSELADSAARKRTKKSTELTDVHSLEATEVAEPEEDEELEMRQEEIEEAAIMPVADEISEDEPKELVSHDRALIRFADFMSAEISKEADRLPKELEEDNKTSPPRKQKNKSCILLRKANAIEPNK